MEQLARRWIYNWGEHGIAKISDDFQRLYFGVAATSRKILLEQIVF